MREIQLLRRHEVIVVGRDSEIKWLEVGGTFGHYHYVGSVYATGRFTQMAVGKHMVFRQRMIVFRYHNRHRCFHIAVLEGIVQNYHLQSGVKSQKFCDTGHAVLAYGHCHFAVELVIYLIGFVAYVTRSGRCAGHNEALGRPAVATAEYSYLAALAECINKILNMRCLARASHGKIANAYHRYVKFFLSENLPVEELIPHIGNAAVDFRTRQQYQFGGKRAFPHGSEGIFIG